MNKRRIVWMAMAGALALATPVHAAKQKDPAKEAQRRMQIEMKKIQDEKAAISAELEVIKKKSGDLEAAASRAEHRRAALDKEAAGLRQDKTALTEKVAQLEQALSEEKKSLSETHANLNQETGKRKSLEQMLGTRDKELDSCETKNRTLYRYQVELIKRAQSRGTLNAILESEPITGLGRIEVENLMEEYRDKVEAEKIISLPKRTAVAP